MHPPLNPFRPGAGMQPPALVGRQSEIDYVDLMVAKSRRRRNDGGVILYGLRGVGKTVLLNKLNQIVSAAGWVTVSLEARPGEAGRLAARQSLARGLAFAGRQMKSRFGRATDDVKTALSSIASFSLSLGGVKIDIGEPASDHRANSGLLEVDLEELVRDVSPALQKNDSALAVFIDEMQDLDPDLLIALLAAQHRASQDDLPFYIIGAGLSTIRKTITEARSYSERFTIREVGPLAPDVARIAVGKPAMDLGAVFHEGALELIVQESRGYPFFLQTYGKTAWDLAPDRNIDIDIARAAIAEGDADLNQGFFPARWDRATHAERQYLRMLVRAGGTSAGTREIASLLGVAPSALSTVRQSLIEKGIIYAERRGYVSFTVPNMDRFILSQPEFDEDDE